MEVIVVTFALALVLYSAIGWAVTGYPPKPWMVGERRTALLESLEAMLSVGAMTVDEACEAYERGVGCFYLHGRHAFGPDSSITRLFDAHWKWECEVNGWRYEPLFSSRKLRRAS